MLDMKLLREQPDKVREALLNRNESTESVDRALEKDEQRRTLLVEKEQLQARRNELSKQVPKAQPQERAALIEESKAIGPRIAELDHQTDEVEAARVLEVDVLKCVGSAELLARIVVVAWGRRCVRWNVPG